MNLGLGLSLTSPRGAFFTPAALANIAHWYRSDAANVSLDGSNNVSQWNDLIGSAHLIQGTAGSRPAYNATSAAFNNRPTLSSAGSKVLAAAGVTSTQPFTLWMVGKATGTSGTVISYGPSTAPGPGLIVNGSGNWQLNAGSGLNSTFSVTTAKAVLGKFNGASSFVGANNWVAGGASGTAGTNNGTALGAFAYTNGTFSSVAEIAEIILQNAIPTANEIAGMAAYFTSLYGFTIT